jgi:hypothetical protein
VHIEPRSGSVAGPIVDSDMDSLFILPLRVVPFETDSLRRARLIKSHRMESVVEVFAERGMGSGQISVGDLPQHFNWRNGSHGDYAILRKLAELPSFDVYTLRRSLRALDVPVNNYGELKLTDEKNRQLTGYMQRFTLPLIREVYGESAQDVRRFEDLVLLFKDPDVKRALARLKQMAEKLHITVDHIPRFIEDYGDIFLSLSYYNHCLDRLSPLIESFVASMTDLRKSMQVRNDHNLMSEIERQEKMLTGLINFLKRMFQDFGVMSRDLWSNLSAEKFDTVREFIEGTQVKVGGVLCGLTVKMNAWANQFPSPRAGGPGARSEFVMTEMRPGMTELIAIARGTA